MDSFLPMHITFLLLTNGGPGVQTSVLAFEIYRQAFRLNDIGYAARCRSSSSPWCSPSAGLSGNCDGSWCSMKQSDSRGATVALRRVPSYRLLTAISLLFIGPILWMVTSSLKSRNEVLRYPPTLIPEEIRWENYVEVFTLQPFGQQFLNSVFVMVAICTLTLLVAIPAGYAIARVKPIGASVIFRGPCSAASSSRPKTVIIPALRALGEDRLDRHLLPDHHLHLDAGDSAGRHVRAAAGVRHAASGVRGGGPPGRGRALAHHAWNLPAPGEAVDRLGGGLHRLVQLEPVPGAAGLPAYPDVLTVPVALTLFEDLAGPRWDKMAATTLSVIR